MTGNKVPGPERIQVECYSGHKAEERPLAFCVGGQRKLVTNIIDQWAGEDHTHFKLLADDRRVYILRYDRADDFWTMERVMDPIGYH